VAAERKRIGLREVRALRPGEIAWDTAVPGFGARRQRGPAISYFVFYRTRDGRQRWFTIGRHGAPWTPDTARDEARRLLGEVVAGHDPAAAKQAAREALTVAELCDRYLAEMRSGRLLTRRGEPKRPSTVGADAGRIERHVRPLLGRLPAAALTRADVEDFMHRVAQGETAVTVRVRARGVARVTGGRGAASRAVSLLSAIYGWATGKGLVPGNPVRGVRRFADRRRERRLSDAEYAALGAGLREAEAAGVWPPAVACATFLTLTGWRKNEAAELTWGEVDLTRRTARLRETKTGASVRPLSEAACDVLRGMPRVGAGARVFPSTRGEARMTFQEHWSRILRLAGLPKDVTPHVLRHSFVSLGNDLGFTEATIGMICGHRGHGGGTMTRGYIHAGDAVFGAADRIAAATRQRLAGESVAEIVRVVGAHRGAA
jgi:integrase